VEAPSFLKIERRGEDRSKVGLSARPITKFTKEDFLMGPLPVARTGFDNSMEDLIRYYGMNPFDEDFEAYVEALETM